MSRLSWFRRYLTESKTLRVIYAIYGIHLLLYLTRYTPLNQSILISVMLGLIVILPLISLFKFIQNLWYLSKTEDFPSDTFTYELAKTVPQIAIATVFSIASIAGLWQLYKNHLPSPPINYQAYIFIYSYSIGFWLFFFMSRLLTKKEEE